MSELGNSLSRTLAIIIKELRQLSRDRMTFALILMIPMVQLILFGYAINTDVRHIEVGVVDLSQSSWSRELLRVTAATQAVDFHHSYGSVQEAEQAITRGEVKAVLYLPADLPERLVVHPSFTGQGQTSRQPALTPAVGQWLVDGSDTLVASSIRGLRTLPLDEVAGRPHNPALPVLEVVQYFNAEQRSVVNIVPGLLAIILTMTMILFTSAAIVREREHGNMEFLITTPVKPLELMIGKITPYMLVGILQISIILTMGHLVFDVPIRGSALNILGSALLFIAASLTLGLVISTIARTQLQAMQMTIFILLPSILLSGFMFPYDAMPEPAQYIAEALPATHFIRLIRGVVLREAQISDMPADAIWLALFALGGLLVAAKRFHKQLE
ncbi:ABC transporter permease [Parathalassolituus penaei]|uniref:Transport permease protein n=1 Tax=Parathalassolituus penaei TaxID=2997323 RepID=A0A9X3EFZ4_9GAMM|nr:ABC transporter permease [Parathalassolituus penaei]MCY0966536.1 ABC transporter permease [Parathalassolituus penaei]